MQAGTGEQILLFRFRFGAKLIGQLKPKRSDRIIELGHDDVIGPIRSFVSF